MISLVMGVVNFLLKFVGHRIDARTELEKARIDAAVQQDGHRVQNNTNPISMFIMAVAGIPPALLFGAIYLDTLFRFGWGIPSPPAPYDLYGWAIVSSFFVLRIFNK